MNYIIDIMSLVKVYTCGCNPGHTYSSSSSFSSHKKSARHKVWEDRSKDDIAEIKKRDNEIFSLKLKIKDRDEHIEKLILEKNIVQQELDQSKINLSEVGDTGQLLSLIENLKNQNTKLKFTNNKLSELLKKVT
jgi:hypothetical protein